MVSCSNWWSPVWKQSLSRLLRQANLLRFTCWMVIALWQLNIHGRRDLFINKQSISELWSNQLRQYWKGVYHNLPVHYDGRLDLNHVHLYGCLLGRSCNRLLRDLYRNMLLPPPQPHDCSHADGIRRALLRKWQEKQEFRDLRRTQGIGLKSESTKETIWLLTDFNIRLASFRQS